MPLTVHITKITGPGPERRTRYVVSFQDDDDCRVRVGEAPSFEAAQEAVLPLTTLGPITISCDI